MPVLLVITAARLHAQNLYNADAARDSKNINMQAAFFPRQPNTGLNWFSDSIEQSPEKEISCCSHGTKLQRATGNATAAGRMPAPLSNRTLVIYQDFIPTAKSLFRIYVTGTCQTGDENNSNSPVYLTEERNSGNIPAKTDSVNRNNASPTGAPVTPTPVSIVSIKAVLKKAAVQLNWEAREELNLNVYEVERSTEGSGFQTIGLVFPWDNQEASNSYRFTDQHPLSGINYYRLRGVDKHGGIQYSGIVSAGTAPLPVKHIAITPNPVKGNIRAVFRGLEKAVYVVELRNISGQLQVRKTINIQQDGQVEILKPGPTPAGIYWLTISDQQQHTLATSRVMVQ